MRFFSAAQDRTSSLGIAKLLLLLLIFSLAFMQPPIRVLGFLAAPTDFIFLAAAAALGLAVIRGEPRLRWHGGYWIFIIYFVAMAASALPLAGWAPWGPKLLTQIYLLSLPVLIFSLVDDAEDLRRAFRWWLAGTAVVGLVAVLTLLAYYSDREHPLLQYTIFQFGTLPPGDYPRVRLTFLNANMLCNYLTASLMILLIARRLAWISLRSFLLLLSGIALGAAFTISPGLGGIALGLGLWVYLENRCSRPLLARLFLLGGLVAAALFVLAMSVTPIIHPTAPFLFNLPYLDFTLAPSGRLMIWLEGVKNIAADPLLGRGIGTESVYVRYLSPSGHLQTLTDAHNTYLNLAIQCGLGGLAAVIALTVYAWRYSLPFRIMPNDSNVVRLGLGIAFLNCFAYQGLGGSYEDARHLWILFGLLLASGRIEGQGSRLPRTAYASSEPAAPAPRDRASGFQRF